MDSSSIEPCGFYVNNGWPVSISGTTSAAGSSNLQYQTIRNVQHELEPAVNQFSYAQHLYDPSLNDLIDKGYPQYAYTESPISDISTGDGDDPLDPSDRSQSYYSNPEFMAPTALVDVRAADSSGSNNGQSHKMRKFKNPQLAVQQRRQANMRERRRMKSINHAFDGLRQKIPTLPYEKKLSKVDTLKLAINYIQFLQELIETDDQQGKPNQGSDSQAPNQQAGNVKQKSRSHSQRVVNQIPPAKKIIIQCRTAFSCTEEIDPPLRGHSLSWSRVGEPNSHSLMMAKVWRPQNPQGQQSEDTSH